MGNGNKWKQQRGSATIEAAVGLTAFLFAIFTILGFVNFCRAQMLVSSAMDTAAREMSQYAYFYEMSGLQKFEGKLDDNAKAGKDNVNEIIGTMGSLYESLMGAKDTGVQTKTEIENMVKAGQVDLTAMENTLGTVKNTGQDVLVSIQSVGNSLKDVGNDPMLYIRSLVSIIGAEGMEAAKRALAVPMTRSFVAKQFGANTQEADLALERLGIRDGLDGMNFNLSNLFSDENHEDIELTVLYRVKLLQVFDWVVLEAKVSKVAACRAWLGGDDVQDSAADAEAAQAASGSEAGEGSADATEPTEATEPTGSTDPTETTEPAVVTSPKWQGGTYSGSVPFLYYLSNTKGLVIADAQGLQQDKPLVFGDSASTVKADDDFDGMLFLDMLTNLQDIAQYVEAHDDEEVERVLVYEIFVPENISEEEYEKLEDEVDEAEFLIDMAIDSQQPVNGRKAAKNVDYEIVIKKVGGNYDYSAGGGQ